MFEVGYWTTLSSIVIFFFIKIRRIERQRQQRLQQQRAQQDWDEFDRERIEREAVDWEALRARIDAAQERLEQVEIARARIDDLNQVAEDLGMEPEDDNLVAYNKALRKARKTLRSDE